MLSKQVRYISPQTAVAAKILFAYGRQIRQGNTNIVRRGLATARDCTVNYVLEFGNSIRGA